ncbi:type II toxin-antitoxin system RelE/ParE family toxin [Pseudomonas putida]|uniref:type II toxin-antitoxin system RelE/ParE family toxin n=1 Tax=Pseudomonas putida TaxID=303 RepID=UPI0009A1FD33|nr:type II toxin-antitoxin system RelE/ParE family toxin [Pseudomonas putida]
MTNHIDTTPQFDDWLDGLKDPLGRGAINGRILRAAGGNFGDTEPVGEGLSEMRVFVGPGYRIYFVRAGTNRYVILYGSGKSDQARGIRRAKEILNTLRGKQS